MTPNKNIFRASYTILDQWQSGNWEQAIKTYFKLEQFVTPQMAEGRRYHEEWADHINKTKTTPLVFGGKPLNKPEAEQKTVVKLADWLNLVGIIDCYDEPTVYEWKTGKQSSEKYAGSRQGGIYALLATYSKRYVEKIEIYHYDQYIKKADMSIIWVTDDMLYDTHNWIITLAAEMHDYLLTQGLYERFGKNLIV